MNESRNPIDELFRKGLEGYSVEPSADLFENIMQKRSRMHRILLKLKTNTGKLTLFLGGMVFLAFGVWAILQQSETEASQLSHVPQEQSPQNVSDLANPNPTFSPEPARIQTEESVESTLNPVLKAENDLYQIKSESVTNLDKSLNPVRPKANNAAIIDPEKSDSPTEMSNEVVPVETPNNPTENMINPVEKEKPIELEDELVTQVEEKQDEVISTKKEESNTKQEITAAPPLTPSPWYLDLMASPDIMSRQLNHPNSTYAQARRDSEKIQSAFSIQLRAGYQLNKAISIQTGIMYSQINEELNFNKNYTWTEVVNQEKTGVIQDPINGPTQIKYTVRDTITHQDEVKGKSNNRYTFIDIPIMLNYRFFVGNKWALGVSGGPSFNLAFRQSGQILREDQMGFIELGKAESPYRTVAGVNLLFNMNASYRLNQHFDLLFEPGMRLGMSSLTHSQSGLSQRYNGAQLFGGVRYRF